MTNGFYVSCVGMCGSLVTRGVESIAARPIAPISMCDLHAPGISWRMFAPRQRRGTWNCCRYPQYTGEFLRESNFFLFDRRVVGTLRIQIIWRE